MSPWQVKDYYTALSFHPNISEEQMGNRFRVEDKKGEEGNRGK